MGLLDVFRRSKSRRVSLNARILICWAVWSASCCSRSSEGGVSGGGCVTTADVLASGLVVYADPTGCAPGGGETLADGCIASGCRACALHHITADDDQLPFLRHQTIPECESLQDITTPFTELDDDQEAALKSPSESVDRDSVSLAEEAGVLVSGARHHEKYGPSAGDDHDASEDVDEVDGGGNSRSSSAAGGDFEISESDSSSPGILFGVDTSEKHSDFEPPTMPEPLDGTHSTQSRIILPVPGGDSAEVDNLIISLFVVTRAFPGPTIMPVTRAPVGELAFTAPPVAVFAPQYQSSSSSGSLEADRLPSDPSVGDADNSASSSTLGLPVNEPSENQSRRRLRW